MTPLIVKLGLNKGDFQSGAESARKDMERLTESVGETDKTLALLKRQAREAGEAVDAGLTSSIKETRKELSGLKSDLRSATADYNVLRTSIPPLPIPSTPRAAIRVGESAVEGATSAGISRIGALELGHVGRSLAGSAAAGIPLDRSLLLEAPRILSALGPILAGLASLLPALVAGGAAVAGGVGLSAAERDARHTRLRNDQVGNVFNRQGDTVSELDKELAEAEKDEIETRHKRHSKLQHFANLAGKGLEDEDIENITKRKRGAAGVKAGRCSPVSTTVVPSCHSNKTTPPLKPWKIASANSKTSWWRRERIGSS